MRINIMDCNKIKTIMKEICSNKIHETSLNVMTNIKDKDSNCYKAIHLYNTNCNNENTRQLSTK
jgi:hypothetical protein